MAIDVDLLRGIPYFAGLGEADLEAVSQRMFEQSIERGDMVLLEDEMSIIKDYTGMTAVRPIVRRMELKKPPAEKNTE